MMQMTEIMKDSFARQRLETPFLCRRTPSRSPPVRHGVKGPGAKKLTPSHGMQSGKDLFYYVIWSSYLLSVRITDRCMQNFDVSTRKLARNTDISSYSQNVTPQPLNTTSIAYKNITRRSTFFFNLSRGDPAIE